MFIKSDIMKQKSINSILKAKFLKYLKERNPKIELWISRLLIEIEKRNETLELKWSQPLPNKDFPISAQFLVRKWGIAPFEILLDDFFIYFVEPRFYFDGHGEAGNVPLWKLPNDLETELTNALKNKPKGGGILVNIGSKRKFTKVVKALDAVIQYSNNAQVIWNKKSIN